MVPAHNMPEALLERLPPVQGRLRACVPLAPVTWFRVGGPAEVVFRPAGRGDLGQFIADKPAGVEVTAIGVGSNLLVRDGGVDGVVVRLGRGFTAVDVDGEGLRVGAGALDANVAQAALEAGLTGLEFLSGIPGTIGGALAMNAGAYGREMKDVVQGAEAIDAQGHLRTLSPADLGLGYRSCAVPADWIFTAATLAAPPGDPAAISAGITAIREARQRSQPIRTRTGGSTFRNPDGDKKAWELISEAGCRGLARGGAVVSEHHANFLINTGEASAADLEELGEEVRQRVRDQSGVTLEWEIRRLGRADGSGPCSGAPAGVPAAEGRAHAGA